MKKLVRYSVLLGSGLATCAPACDLCSVYSAAQAHGDVGKGVFAGFAEQFTHSETTQEDGDRVSNLAHQRMDSAVSQLFAGYNFNDRFGVQFNVPIIYRSFKRADDDGGIESGTESGIGDVSLLGHANIYAKETKDFTFRTSFIGGVKFPTGDSDRIGEEDEEHEPLPGTIESGIHGHDLALGSGSVDGIVGASFFTRWKRVFMHTSAQYAIRTEGDFDYRFADDLTWSGGPGVLLLLKDDYTLSLAANISGEYKEEDEHAGETEDDTANTTVFIGPKLMFTWSDRLSAELAGGLPVIRDNSGFQVVPDYRVHAGLVYHF
jgi:hypothetical protein